MADSNNPSFGNSEDVRDMSTSDNGLSDDEQYERDVEIFDRLVDGRGHSESVVLESPHGPIECDIELSALDRSTRWDTLKSLPDGMFEAAGEDVDESDITLSTSAIPGGDGVNMLELLLKETLNANNLSDGQLQSVIENDLADNVVIELGMQILEMSFEQGQVSGFQLQ